MPVDLLLLLSIAFWQLPERETALEGRWRNPIGSVIISIEQCGDAPCGKVQWASEKALADARMAGTDQLIGLELLTRIEPAAGGRWKARLFVPDLKKTSRVKLRLVGADRLKLRGCAMGALLCKSQIWTRVGD